MLPLAHARAWVAASVLLVAAVLLASLAPLSLPLSSVPTHFDKLEHAFAYLCLAVWFTGLVARGHYWRVAVALLLLGVVVEILQAAMPFGRQGDPLDLVANLIGIGLGVAIATWTTGGWAPRIEAWLNRS